MNSKAAWIVGIVLWIFPISATLAEPHTPMPGVDDHSSMWWADGFPAVVPSATWKRVIQTGRYAFVLETDTLKVPHFGALAGVGGDWESLPEAALKLQIDVNGKSYQCTNGGAWSRYAGPRLIEAGRFFQRADVTGLHFESAQGEILNTESRFETAAWPRRLGLVFTASAGMAPIGAGEASFGRVGGGFGLDGTNAFEIPHSPEIDPEEFTLDFWAFVPTGYRASEGVWPWLVCKNRNEMVDGNFGIQLVDGKAQARMNIGGGRAAAVTIGDRPVRVDTWNHFVLSYDGDTLRFFVNGARSGEQRIGKKRKPGRHALVFGRREDNYGDGYHFRGVIDDVRLFDRALDLKQLGQNPLKQWRFRADGVAAQQRPRIAWENPVLTIKFAAEMRAQSLGPEVFLAIDPIRSEVLGDGDPVKVDAPGRPLAFDPARGWHRINLDGIQPERANTNDAIELIPFVLSNPTDQPQVARLMFEKTAGGIRQGIGSPITGMSAILRDPDGHPTGIPVQLSKNWHNDPEGGAYAGTWFHGLTQVRLAAGETRKLELAVVYGHWGGVAAASHAQLSLVGWGSNQRWDESALGSWGESICYEPGQAQANCTITDVRPLMVTPMSGKGKWRWTNNVGGGDFFRMFDLKGKRIAHSAMRADYQRQGPCLTEVTYSGKLGEGIVHSETVSLGRTDDIVRGSYRLRFDVKAATDFSRFVIFQVGADTYNFTNEAKMAWGNETGLVKEWPTRQNAVLMACAGRVPWISLHEGRPRDGQAPTGAWANRGIVIRSWKARLGGDTAAPWVVEHDNGKSSTIDLVPPPGVGRLEVGDFVEAIVEYIVMPQSAADYYGPNKALRKALVEDGNTWKMIHREAIGNDRRVMVEAGQLLGLHPDIRLRADDDGVVFSVAGGLGYVPITIEGLSSPRGYELEVGGQRLNQSVHGNDFWQTDYDPASRTWSRTYNVSLGGGETQIKLLKDPS
ncbi:MAG: hypothetical protein ACI8XO_002694 [Verrucomicrobiales bacterium]|jgi:hypothetical protein